MNANANTVLTPIGDVELWYAEAQDGSWRLPVHVEWKEDTGSGNLYGLVIPGTCFYHNQFLVMQGLVGGYSLEERSDRWLIPKADMERLLHKAPGIHAAFYYFWPDAGHAPIPSHHSLSVSPRQPTDTFGSFIEFVSFKSGIPADVVSVVMTTAGYVAPEWMIELRQPINFGCVRLMAVPFRSNWKEIVMFKLKSDGVLDALLAPWRECLRRLTAMRLAATLCSPQNIALRGGVRHSRIDYSIEAMTTPAFDRAVEKIEEARIQEGDYVKRYANTIEKLYDSIVECLVHHTRKTQAAWATVRKGGAGGGLAFFPATSKSFRDVPLDELPVDIVPTGSDFSVFAEKEGTRQRITLSAPAPKVPKVSGVSRPAHDVRKRKVNGDLDKSRPGGTDRVPMLDAGQGSGPGQSVLSGGSTQAEKSSRMDGT